MQAIFIYICVKLRAVHIEEKQTTGYTTIKKYGVSEIFIFKEISKIIQQGCL